jgi:hypothetical protein
VLEQNMPSGVRAMIIMPHARAEAANNSGLAGAPAAA